MRNATSLLLATTAVLLLGAPAAFAAPGPSPVPVKLPAPAKPKITPLKTVPFLQRTSGLTAPTSKATPGAAGLDPAQIAEYVKSVTALKMAAEFHGDPDAPALDLGGKATIGQGADVKLSGSFSKKDGEDEATLDGLELDATGVKFGPSIDLGPIHTGPLLKLQKVAIDSKGEIAIKLNSWIPEIDINKIEHKANGDIVLHARNWWVPDVTIQANGDITTTIGIGPFHITKKLGHLDFNPAPVLASWPPKIETALGMAGALQGLSKAGDGKGSSPFSQLAGTVDWNVQASAHDPHVKLNGITTDATVNAALSGEGHLSKGELTSSGEKNKVHVDVELGGTKVDQAKAAIALHDAKASLDGTYSLDLPLADKQHMKVDFQGHADVSGDATSAKLTLPDGAHVSVGTFGVSDSGDVKFHKDAAGTAFALSNDHWKAQVTGPIHVDGLKGPVSSVDLAGQLTSTGSLDASPSGITIKSTLNGTETTTSDTTITNKDGTRITLKKGSKVDVALGDLDAGIQANDLAHPTAKVAGTVGVQANVGDLKVKKNGATVDVASTTVNAQVTADLGLANGKVSGTADATASAHANLGDSKLDVAGKNASITVGSKTINLPFDKANVDLASATVDANGKAHVVVDGSSVTGNASGSLKTHANVGDSKVSAGGRTIDLPSGTVDASASGQASFDGKNVTGTGQGSLKAHENVGEVKLGPLDLPASAIDVSGNGQLGIAKNGVSANGQLQGSAKLTKNGSLDLGKPGDAISADTTIKAGTGIAVNGNFDHKAGAATTAVSGRASGDLETNTTIGVNGKNLDATVNTSATVGVGAPFAGTVGPGGKITVDTSKTSATIPVRLGLLAGTKIAYTASNGQVSSFTLENSQSYIQFTTPVKLGPDGKPLLQEIDGVDILLSAGPSQVLILGSGFTIPAGNFAHVKGKVTFGPGGLHVTGSATLGATPFGHPVSFTINF